VVILVNAVTAVICTIACKKSTDVGNNKAALFVAVLVAINVVILGVSLYKTL